MMNRYAPAALLLLLLTCAPALAQSTSYSFDNFDVANGVRIYSEPAKSRAPVPRSRRRVGSTTATQLDRNVISTALVYPAMADGGRNSSLHGYTTGSAEVDNYGWRIPPYSETQEYVRRISRRYSLLRDPNAALYAPRVSSAQVAKLRDKQPAPLTDYERTVLTVRLPDGRLQLMSQ